MGNGKKKEIKFEHSREMRYGCEMDAPLKNARWEQVAILIAAGMQRAIAYRQVFPESSARSARSSCATLVARPTVKARIQAIQQDTLTQYSTRRSMSRDALHDWLSAIVDHGLMGKDKDKVPPRDRLKAASLLASIGGYHAPARSEKLSLHASIDATAAQEDFAKRLAAAKQIKGEGGPEEREVVVTPLAHNMDSEIPGVDSGNSDMEYGALAPSEDKDTVDKIEPSLESASDSQADNKVDSSRESPLDPEMGHGL